jgi:hypothetical protein
MTGELEAAAAALPETETLRDKYIMAALSGVIAANRTNATTTICELALYYADAMMEARKK